MIRQADALIPTPWGNFLMIAYADSPDIINPHLAIVSQAFKPENEVLTRLHSECLTGDIFGSRRCDCGEQLHAALRMTATEGGVVLYLRQEGRGIGLINKLRAYRLQDTGLNTAEANVHLGFPEDGRSYEDAILILKDLGIKKIKLLTNNPLKLEAFESSGISIVERVPLIIEPNQDNHFYLKTKHDLMGHLLGFE
jgi:3,4-dihydroxy 2-butanone 4-phosphate synthase/GTP cyclohydrolase II